MQEKISHCIVSARFEEHLKSQTPDPRDIEHFFQVWKVVAQVPVQWNKPYSLSKKNKQIPVFIYLFMTRL